MAVSTIPAFKAALLETLRARTTLRRVIVAYGNPYPSAEPEWIWLGDVTGDQTAAALGQQRREESYTLTVTCNVQYQGASGDQQKAATERAFVLAGEVEQALRADASVGGVVRTAQVASPLALVERRDDRAVESAVTLGVAVRARI